VPGDPPAIIAHRGGNTGPENTMPAFKAAVRAGADYVETDLQRTADGVWVLMHDSDVRRAIPTAATRYPARDSYEVSSFTLAELRELEVGGTTVATLRELLDFIAGKPVRALVEPKVSGGPTGPESLVALLNEYPGAVTPGPDDQVTLVSFSASRLAAFRDLGPGLDLGYIYYGATPQPASIPAANVFLPNYRDLSPTDVATVHEAGLQVFAWTVNDPADMYALSDLGVDAVITDDPTLARRALFGEPH
jgi:glycerophosphoryl diester phosphodiesterase